MSPVWSDEQRRCLDALGYTLYRSASVSVTDRATQAVASAASTAHDPLLPDAFLTALLRAAHCDPARIADADDWLRIQQISSLTQLRNDPVAKRALWPRLRALRQSRTRP